MSKPKVYIETSTISFLTSRPSNNLLILFKQLQTQQWWAGKDQFESFISETVKSEIEEGDPLAAALRLNAVAGIPHLEYNNTVENIAEALLREGIIPPQVTEDALHIAYAAAHEMDFLITWNQKHIAAGTKQFLIHEMMLRFNLRGPLIITPEAHLALMEGD